MTWNSPGCTATFTNESIITTCDASSNCAFGPINNMVVTVLCNGSSWTLTDNSGGTTVTETGSCTCEKVVSTTVATPVLVPSALDSSLPSTILTPVASSSAASKSSKLKKPAALIVIGISLCTIIGAL
ncbi:hypothetical protein Unana1_08690 [Umbelopsis nana]